MSSVPPAPAPQSDAQFVPTALILDTNILMRLLVLGFGTQNDVFSKPGNFGARLVLAPHQLDEVWNNLPGVFEEHVKGWNKRLREIREKANKLGGDLENLKLLCVESDGAVAAATTLRGEVQGLRYHGFSWSRFERYVDDVLARFVDLEAESPRMAERILTRAGTRAERGRRPYQRSKPHCRVDCNIWETVVEFLTTGESVWFATTDGDFLHGEELHPSLRREIESLQPQASEHDSDPGEDQPPSPSGDRFRLFREHRDRTLNKPAKDSPLVTALADAETAYAFAATEEMIAQEQNKEGFCWCGENALIDTMQCSKCHADNYSMSGEESYRLEEGSEPGCFVVSGAWDDGVVECEHCENSEFFVYFESLCSYHSHQAEKAMRD